MWTAIELAATLTECLIITHFMTRFLGYKSENYSALKFLSCVSILALDEWFIGDIFTETTEIAVLIIICFAYCILFLKGSFFDKIFCSLMPCILMLLTSVSTLAFFRNILGSSFYDLIETQNAYRLMILFVSKFLLFISARLLLSLKKKEEYSLSKTEWAAILTVFSVTLIVGISIFDALLRQDYGDIFAMISIAGLVIINVIIFSLFIKISKDNRRKLKLALLELQVKEQEHSMLKINDQYTEILKIRHDMKNYIGCALTLLKQGDYEKAEDYLSDISYDKLGSITQYINTSSSVVNAVVNSKLTLCHECGIIINCNIPGSIEKITDIDLSILLSNLFDNAIEACQRNKGESKIDFKISENKGYLKIVLKNTIEESVLKKNPKLRTIKKNKLNHGFGLKTIHDIVKKYDGMINMSEENGEFVTDIMLNIFN
ncbi:MAG: GHKL domain-containing protein [Oscillospiraceae bacterium]|jgi:signal transduction histidine kinase|nr:GHKL domain-containing protein [Oscillospiraceae bacterium]